MFVLWSLYFVIIANISFAVNICQSLFYVSFTKSLFNPDNNLNDIVTVIVCILQIMKLRFGDIKYFVQGSFVSGRVGILT